MLMMTDFAILSLMTVPSRIRPLVLRFPWKGQSISCHFVSGSLNDIIYLPSSFNLLFDSVLRPTVQNRALDLNRTAGEFKNECSVLLWDSFRFTVLIDYQCLKALVDNWSVYYTMGGVFTPDNSGPKTNKLMPQ